MQMLTTPPMLIPPMRSESLGIPLIDLKCQHQPLQHKIERAIQSVMLAEDFILGRALTDFEIAFAHASGSHYGIGVGCGTDAIALGLRACGIGQGDEVIVPANTFVATLIGILQTGATPVLVDCDPNTALIDLMAAEKAITTQTRAIVPVHLYGQMVSPHQLLDLAGTYDLLIFEDAAQSHLAEREGYRAGSVGLAAAFSFYPSKNLGALGDGGMVLTQEPHIAEAMRSLRNYGSTRKHHHLEFGVNSRLDTLQAAVLGAKLPYLPEWNSDRQRVAQQYQSLLAPLAELGIVPMQNVSGMGHVYHLYVVRVTDDCALDRWSLQSELEARGIQTGVHYPTPCHLQPAFQHLGYQAGDFPHAEQLCRQVLSLPMYPGLSDGQVCQVAAALTSSLTLPLSQACAAPILFSA